MTKNITRRTCLKVLAAAPAVVNTAAIATQSQQMLKRRIPSSGEMIPVLGLGTYRAFDRGTNAAERAPAKEVLRLFVECGGAMVDSSPMYGGAEGVVGDLAAELSVRDKLFIATKVWTQGRAAGIAQMEQSEHRLRTDRIDLMQVHNLQDVQTHLKTLRAWKDEQRIRYLGITHYHSGAYDVLEKLMKVESLDFVQLNYNIVTREAEQRLLPLALDRGIAIIVNRPFRKAALFGKVRDMAVPGWAADFDCKSWAQFFLKFVVSHPAVTTAIPATSKPKHLIDNMQAGVGRLPDSATREKMAELVAGL